MNKPTCEELFNELSDSIKTTRGPWRHGNIINEIFYRHEDDTYWQADYCLSTDGETNDLREGSARIYQVKPVVIQQTNFVKI